MTVYHIDKVDALTQQIVSMAFPEYHGRKVKLSTDVPSQLNSYWSGGSCDTFVFVELSTLKSFEVNSNHPYFEANRPRELPDGQLPNGVVLIRHAIYCGKDMGITIFANSESLAPLLPASAGEASLSLDEQKVLYYTRTLKASYNGRTRQQESGLSLQTWNTCKARLIDLKLLNRAGAITPAGRNACPERL